MRSRIAHHLDFPDYSAEELMAIARLMLASQSYRFSAGGDEAFAEYIPLRMGLAHFAKGRSIRNALDGHVCGRPTACSPTAAFPSPRPIW